MAGSQTAPNIAAADNDRDLDPEVVNLFHLARDFLDDLRRNRFAGAALAQSFAAQFENDPLIRRLEVSMSGG